MTELFLPSRGFQVSFTDRCVKVQPVSYLCGFFHPFFYSFITKRKDTKLVRTHPHERCPFALKS